MRKQLAVSPDNATGDRKFARKTDSRLNIRSPKSHSSSASENAFFINNIARPTLKISKAQADIYKALRQNSRFQIPSEPVIRSKSQKLLARKQRDPKISIFISKQANQIEDPTFADKSGSLAYLDQTDNAKIISKLKAQNVMLKSKLQSITKQLEKILKGKQTPGKLTSLKTIDSSKLESKLVELQKKNRQLVEQLKIMECQNLQIKQITPSKTYQTSNCSKWTCEQSFQSDSYVRQVQEKYFLEREQNKKLRIEIDCLRRRVYSDLQGFKRSNSDQLFRIKQKYMKLLNDYKEMTKKHCDLALKMKRTEKLIQSSAINPSQRLESSLSFSQCSELNSLQ